MATDIHREDVGVIEAMLLSSDLPIEESQLARAVSPGADVKACLETISREWEGRSLCLVRTARGWAARTAPQHSSLCRALLQPVPKLSRAAMETLCVVALFGPVTRPEIERVRGVSVARGTLDLLVWSGLVRPGPRRDTPGNPLTFDVTPAFLDRFALMERDAVPGHGEVRAAGLDDLSRAMQVPTAEGDRDD